MGERQLGGRTFLFPHGTVASVVAVEITPIINNDDQSFWKNHGICDASSLLLSSPMAKLQIREKSLRSPLCVRWDDAPPPPSVFFGNGVTKTRCGYVFDKFGWEDEDDSKAKTRKGETGDGCESKKDNDHKDEDDCGRRRFIFHLRSDDPTRTDDVSCEVRVYCRVAPNFHSTASLYPSRSHRLNPSVPVGYCIVTSGTFVCIRPPSRPYGGGSLAVAEMLRNSLSCQDYVCWLDENSESSSAFRELDESILSRYDEETVRSLQLRMGELLRRQYKIGTTPDAFDIRNATDRMLGRCRELAIMSAPMGKSAVHKRPRGRQRVSNSKQEDRMDAAVPFNGPSGATQKSLQARGPFRSGCGLVVHDSSTSSGKKELVSSVARARLGCHAVIVSPGPLFARHGVRADIALERLLHRIALFGASRSQPVCVVLDGLEAFVPPSLSGRLSDPGDPSDVTLNAMAAHLSLLCHSLQSTGRYPYPGDPLHNVGGVRGYCLSVNLCIVGVATTKLDDESRRIRGGGRAGCRQRDEYFRVLGSDVLRYRVPPPSTDAQVTALERALALEGLRLPEPQSHSAVAEVLGMASAVWATRGAGGFDAIARQVRWKIDKSGGGERTATVDTTITAKMQDLRAAMSRLEAVGGESFRSVSNTDRVISSSSDDPFGSLVGGNEEAKTALEDALSLDPAMRERMRAVGLRPPIGILLYGPPGTGKTLLAKALCRCWAGVGLGRKERRNGVVADAGPFFISLKAGEVVRGEVGRSEKIVVGTFETARINSPSVIFIDEFEALFGPRGGGSGRLPSTLLQCMDDVGRWCDADVAAAASSSSAASSSEVCAPVNGTGEARVVILAATNAPWMIDRAFLRPGRFDRVVHVGLPNSGERRDILKVHVGGMKLKRKAEGGGGS